MHNKDGKRIITRSALAIAEFIGWDYEDVREMEYQSGRYPSRVYTPGDDYYISTRGQEPFNASKYPGWEAMKWEEQKAEWFNKKFANRIFKLVPIAEGSL